MLTPEKFPLTLPLRGGGALELAAVVRYLPGRRLVCHGAWNGRPVYAKLFIGGKAGQDAERDASGVRAMRAADIATPELLFDGDLTDGSGHALVFAEVVGSSAEEAWRMLAHDPAARLELITRLVQTAAAHHRAGLIQHDMYLKNFIVTSTDIYTLDGDGIRCHAAPLGRREGLGNLALLLSKFHAEDDVWLPQLLQHYAAARAMELTAAEAQVFPSHVMTHRLRVVRGYADRKVFRNCSGVIVERGWSHFTAIARAHDSEALRRLLAGLETRLRDPDVRMLKNGNTCTVLALPLDGREVVVKRYNIKNFWHGLGRAWRPSRAAASWANAHRLQILGIATAQPLALLERRWGWLRRQAYFIAEHVDAPDALAFFADASVAAERKQQAAQAIAQLLHKLWRVGLVHGDMKASNVLIGADDQPLLLDLDALHEVRCPWRLRRGHARDLRRWMENWRADPLTAGMMRQALQQVYRNEEGLLDAAIGMGKSENT